MKKEQELSAICDAKVVDDQTYFRFSQDKAMDWLQSKVDNICQALVQQSISTSSRSVGAENMKFLGAKESGSDECERKRYAVSLLEDYLSPDMALQLRQRLHSSDQPQIPQEQFVSPATVSLAAASSSKATPQEDYFVDKKYGMKVEEIKLTRSQKQLAKVDKKGMQPITSFFSRPK